MHSCLCGPTRVGPSHPGLRGDVPWKQAYTCPAWEQTTPACMGRPTSLSLRRSWPTWNISCWLFRGSMDNRAAPQATHATQAPDQASSHRPEHLRRHRATRAQLSGTCGRRAVSDRLRQVLRAEQQAAPRRVRQEWDTLRGRQGLRAARALRRLEGPRRWEVGRVGPGASQEALCHPRLRRSPHRPTALGSKEWLGQRLPRPRRPWSRWRAARPPRP